MVSILIYFVKREWLFFEWIIENRKYSLNIIYYGGTLWFRNNTGEVFKILESSGITTELNYFLNYFEPNVNKWKSRNNRL